MMTGKQVNIFAAKNTRNLNAFRIGIKNICENIYKKKYYKTMAIEGGKKLDYRKIEDNQLVLGFFNIFYTRYILYTI